MVKTGLEDAIHDLRYLLNQGYPRDSAIEFVSDHYLLESDDRHLLTRCVFSKEEIADHRCRKVGFDEVEESVSREVKIDSGLLAGSVVESLVWSDVVVYRPPQAQEGGRRLVALEVPHHFVPLLDVSVVPLYRVIVVFKPVFSAGDRDAEVEICYMAELFFERILVLLKLVGHESH